MSHRKYRTPAPATAAGDVAGDVVGDADNTPHDLTGENLTTLRERGELTDSEARLMLSDAVRFLDVLIESTLKLLGTVRLASLRDAIDKDMPLSKGLTALLAAQQGTEVQPVPQSDSPQKRPRGRRHPLLSLISWAISAARLQVGILKMLKPHITTYADSYGNLMRSLKQAEAQAAHAYSSA